MGHFSMEIYAPNGSNLSGNQHSVLQKQSLKFPRSILSAAWTESQFSEIHQIRQKTEDRTKCQ